MSPRFSSGGLNTFDLLGDLTPAERTLTRILLRNTNMSEKAIFDAISELPENKQMGKSEMQAALETLEEKGWVQVNKSLLKKSYTIKQKKQQK